jgi:sugar phosphate isomerase/epimerase
LPLSTPADPFKVGQGRSGPDRVVGDIAFEKDPIMATKYRIALNMEYCRDADLSFEAGAQKAAELGYQWIEPMVHTGWGLLSEVGYFHSWSMEEDPLFMKEICDRYGVKVSSFSSHSPLMKPEAAVPRITRAMIYADYLGTNILNTDEMIKPDWMDDQFAHEAMRYTLKKVSLAAERHKKYVCIEPHGIYTKTSDGLLKIVHLVDSPWMAINWDLGNAYLAGVEDPYDSLTNARDYVRHIHAKDISMEQSDAERGKVTGTPVGCACGEGVIDWERVFDILEPVDREITLSVECGTIDEAERSLSFLKNALGDRLLTEDFATASV